MLIGGVAAVAGPVEMYCFTLFSEGGRFHYEGFGFGSFMFGNIATQIIGYYAIAVVLIPLGYGHLRLRRWARPLALALLWFWVVMGAPLILAFLFALLSAKPLSFPVAVAAVAFIAVAYPALPGLLIRFYRSKDVRMTLADRDPASSWVEGLPIPILALGVLFVYYGVVWHILILFNGVFPLFGHWVNQLPGIVLIDLAVLCLVGLTWGILGRRRWAWWGSLLYFATITASSILTLGTSSWSEILAALGFPPFETEMLQGPAAWASCCHRGRPAPSPDSGSHPSSQGLLQSRTRIARRSHPRPRGGTQGQGKNAQVTLAPSHESLV
jgi:hypothetical protein